MSLPEPPELPPELAEELARARSTFDAHTESLKAWAEMARAFHDELRYLFPEQLADEMLANWQKAWFDSLYSGLMDTTPPPRLDDE